MTLLSRTKSTIALFAAFGAVACQGGVGNDESTSSAGKGGNSTAKGGAAGFDPSGPPGSMAEVVLPPPGASCTPTPSPPRVWRLTHTQFSNTVARLLGRASAAAAGFGTLLDPGYAKGFSNDSTRLATPQLLVEKYLDVAHEAAPAIASNAQTRAPCMATKPTDPTCLREFVQKLGSEAYRRPLEAAESDALLAFYEAKKTELGPDTLKAMITAMLMSPSFAFRTELGDPKAAPGRVPLTQHEVASLLSYSLTDQPPDAELLTLAEQGRLSQTAVREQQSIRLLNWKGSAPAVLENFLGEMVHVSQVVERPKDVQAFPTFTANIAQSAKDEAGRFIREVLWNEDGKFGTLMTASYGFASQSVADALWGAKGSVKGAAVQKFVPPTGQRSGLLTLPAVMAGFATETEGEMVQRGLLVRERFLCQDVPPPPPSVNAVFPPRDPNLTHRQRFDQHRTDPTCASCHKMLDPVGAAFEHYDALGRYQTLDQGKPIDATGIVTDMPNGSDLSFKDATELSSKLATSPDVHECIVRQAFRFFVGRVEQDGDACLLSRIKQGFTASGGHVLTMVAKLAAADDLVVRTK